MFRPLAVFTALLALALVQIARSAELSDAVVRVYAGNAAGSGTLIRADGDAGWVLTAAHVVRGQAAFRVVWHDGHVSGATLLGSDEAYDLALLQITPPPAATTLPLAGDDQWPPPGDSVELIGYGGGRLRQWTAKVNGYALTPGAGRYQTLSVATQTIGGDSGGAMIYRGRLVGVIWGGPLAGPRGPMLATHGTCCVAIGQFIDGLTPANIRGTIDSGCPNGQCPIAPRLSTAASFTAGKTDDAAGTRLRPTGRRDHPAHRPRRAFSRPARSQQRTRSRWPARSGRGGD